VKHLTTLLGLAALTLGGCSGDAPSPAQDTANGIDSPDIVVHETIARVDTESIDQVPNCEELCVGRECGTVGDCECGTCAGGACEDGRCTGCPGYCPPGAECGDDGMFGSCGECPPGDQWSCQNYNCVCAPDCTGRECGSDGCKGLCGACDEDQVCFHPEGLCYPDCHFEEFVFTGAAFKIDSLYLADDGPDSAFGLVLDQLDPYIDTRKTYADALSSGELVLLLALRDGADRDVAVLNLYQGHPTAPKGVCDWQAASCSYSVDAASMHIPTCGPAWRFDDVTLDGEQLDAEGQGARFIIPVPLFSPTTLFPLQVEAARLHATIRADGEGLDDGILAGAVRKQDLLDSLDSWPVEDLVVSIELVKGMLDMFIVPDIDLDGDGTVDAASVGFPFTALGATISGVAAD
jgi:hypothetical protein